MQERVINGLGGARSVYEDLLALGKGFKEHDDRVDSLLTRFCAVGLLTVNKKKSKFAQKSVEFLDLSSRMMISV